MSALNPFSTPGAGLESRNLNPITLQSEFDAGYLEL